MQPPVQLKGMSLLTESDGEEGKGNEWNPAMMGLQAAPSPHRSYWKQPKTRLRPTVCSVQEGSRNPVNTEVYHLKSEQTLGESLNENRGKHKIALGHLAKTVRPTNNATNHSHPPYY